LTHHLYVELKCSINKYLVRKNTEVWNGWRFHENLSLGDPNIGPVCLHRTVYSDDNESRKSIGKYRTASRCVW